MIKRKSPKSTTPESPSSLPGARIMDLIREADRRLAKSPLLAKEHGKASLTDLPLYILAGPAEAGKTSTFLAAGLSPELLAGQAQRESTILPTSVCNFWYASRSIFAEVGGSLFSDDPAQWRTLVEYLCGTGQSMLGKLRGGRGKQASLRGLIWFCDINPFLGMPDPARIAALARQAQEQMLILGETLGSDFPVYVIFTKVDQLPHFADFVHRMAEEEDQQVIGCTLPASNMPASGDVYADAQTRRLLELFNQLYRSLAERRLKLLEREGESARKPGIYEFPREVKRIRDSLVHFLVDAFRPNPLQPGPLLRGFYFTAVRQVPVTTASAGAPPIENVGKPKNLDATVLFQASPLQKSETITAARIAVEAKEATVPRWAFVKQLFHRVILPDPLSQTTGTKNVRRDLRNRVLLSTAIAVCSLFMLCAIRSGWSNWALLSQVQKAAQADFSRSTPGGMPSIADLRSLDQLRQALAPLVEYGQSGAPWRLRWGLYSGGRVVQRAYEAYFQLFQHYFFTGAESTMTGKLAGLQPSTSSVPYNDAYDTLKAYRMITSGKCLSDSTFLVPVFSQSWQSGRSIDPENLPLAEQQIRFYAEELNHKNPYSVEENPELIERGRSFLSSFGGVDRLFRGMIEEANKPPRHPSRIADLAPNFRQVLTGPGEVSAAFTREGWNYVQGAIREPGRRSVGEACVLGSASVQPSGTPEGAQVASQLADLYTRAYVQAWKDFLQSTQVQPFRSAGQAAHSLEILADNRSPLLAALFLAADNTNFPKPTQASASPKAPEGLLTRILPVAAKKTALSTNSNLTTPDDPSAGFARIFQPVREVVRAGNQDRLIDDPNRNYVNALGELQHAMERLQNDSPSNPDLALHEQAQRAVDGGLDAVRQIAQRFNITGAEGVDIQVKRLLESPFRYSMLFIITDPSKAGKDKLAGAVKSLCARFGPLQRKFPFNPQSDVDATNDEVAAVFAPPAGSLFAFEQEIGKMVTRQGKIWVQNPETPEPRLSPEFLQFLNHMTAISETLFPDGNSQMRLRYGLRPLPGSDVESVSLDIDGGNLVVASGQPQAKLFSWPGPPGTQQVLIRVKAGANIPFASYDGTWGIFRMVTDADPRVPGSRTIELSKVRRGHGRPESILDANDKPIQVRLEITDLPGGVDIFDRSFFQIHCPVKIVQ